MSPSLNRRGFVATSLVAAAGSTAGLLAQDPAEGWIDAHVHVWTPDTSRYPLDKSFARSDMQPPSFTPPELFAHCRPSGVSKIVLIQMSFYNYDNRYMVDMIDQHPGVFSGVGIVDHHAHDVSEAMKKLASQGVRGFRLHSRAGSARQWVDDEGMATVWKTARQEGLAVCPLINPSDLPACDALCKRFPGTKVVVDHFARIGITGTIVKSELDALCSLSKYPDVHVKTSAFYALGSKRPPYTDLTAMIRRVVDAFGPERLMWASDCPYQVQREHDYESSIALIRDKIDFLSASDKAQILRETAERVFFA